MVCQVAHRLLARKNNQSLEQSLGGCMRIGDLVKWALTDDKFWLAIVIGETFNDSGISSTQVVWVTGKYVGQRDYIYTEDLEIVE